MRVHNSAWVGKEETLASARRFLGSLQCGGPRIALSRLIEDFERACHAYEEFPELEVEIPRQKIASRLREADDTLSDALAVPLLTFCVALDPAGSPLLGDLLERLARAGRENAVVDVVGALAKYRLLTVNDLTPAIELLRMRGRKDAMLAAFSAAFGHLQLTPELGALGFGESLKSLLVDGAEAAEIDPFALAARVLSARQRIERVRLPASMQNAPERLRSLAARSATRIQSGVLQTPTWPEPPTSVGWPTRRLSIKEFFMQWVPWMHEPGTVVEWLPRMSAASVGERVDQLVRAKRGQEGHIVSGPYYRLPPGEYLAKASIDAGRPWKWMIGSQRVAVLEVVSDVGAKFIATRNLKLADFKQPEQSLEFTLTAAAGQKVSGEIEVRIWTAGFVPLTISSITVERLAGDNSLEPDGI